MRSSHKITASLHCLADAAANIVLTKFRTNISFDNKCPYHYDPVTCADRDAEKALFRIIQSQYPDDGFIGEEYGEQNKAADYVWVVDPIDGTRAFIQGLPTWGILIGLLYHGQPIAGMMCQPYTRERFWSDGQKSYFCGPTGYVSTLTTRSSELTEAQMSTTDPYLFKDFREKVIFETLRRKVRVCRFGSDCYSYSLIAAGQIDVVLETGLQIYDIAALIPIIEKAGGCVTSWSGEPIHTGGQILACGDPKLHELIIDLLNAL
ncbi:MAG TPA: Histidinol-phosphatase [Hyphomicrobiaceae bacterium MAG_BT-2024]